MKSIYLMIFLAVPVISVAIITISSDDLYRDTSISVVNKEEIEEIGASIDKHEDQFISETEHDDNDFNKSEIRPPLSKLPITLDRNNENYSSERYSGKTSFYSSENYYGEYGEKDSLVRNPNPSKKAGNIVSAGYIAGKNAITSDRTTSRLIPPENNYKVSSEVDIVNHTENNDIAEVDENNRTINSTYNPNDANSGAMSNLKCPEIIDRGGSCSH